MHAPAGKWEGVKIVDNFDRNFTSYNDISKKAPAFREEMNSERLIENNDIV